MTIHAWNIPSNQIGEKQFLDWTRGNPEFSRWKVNVMTKPTLDSLLLNFCLVRTTNILLRLSSLLPSHCSRTIDLIAPLLFPTLLLRLSVLNVVLNKEKRVGWNTLARNYIFHLRMTQAELKNTNKETHQLFKKFCYLPYHVLPVSIDTMHIYLFLLCTN